jgi:hypothetical protein
MLSLPVVRESQEHYVVALCVLAYFVIVFVVLKTFQYNKDRFEE